MTQEQLDKIRTAYENESQELGSLLKEAGFSKEQLDSLRTAYENYDDSTFGAIVKSKLDTTSTPIPTERKEPRDLWEYHEELRNTAGVARPFIYQIKDSQGNLLDELQLDKKISKEELDKYANKLQLPNDYSYTETIVEDPNVVAQYLAQKGFSDFQIEQAHSFPRTTRAEMLEKSIPSKALGVIGDALSAPGRVVSSDIGSAVNEALGDDEYDIGSRLGYIGARDDQGIVANVGEDFMRDPALLPSLITGNWAVNSIPKLGTMGMPLTNSVMNARLPVAGAVAGVTDVGIKDITTDIPTGENETTAINYALGGLGGAAIPSAYQAAEKFVPGIKQGLGSIVKNVLPNQPSRLNEVSALTPSPFHEALSGLAKPGSQYTFKDILLGKQPNIEEVTKSATERMDEISKGMDAVPDEIHSRHLFKLADDLESRSENILQTAGNNKIDEAVKASKASSIVDLLLFKYGQAVEPVVQGYNKGVVAPYNKIADIREQGFNLGETSIRPSLYNASQKLPDLLPAAAAYKLPTEFNAIYEGVVEHPYEQMFQQPMNQGMLQDARQARQPLLNQINDDYQRYLMNKGGQ